MNEKIIILLCVAKGRQSLSRGMISDVVRGSHSVRVFSRRLYINSTFGSLKERSEDQVEDMINQLIEQGLLEETADEYPRLILTDAGKKELHEYAASHEM